MLRIVISRRFQQPWIIPRNMPVSPGLDLSSGTQTRCRCWCQSPERSVQSDPHNSPDQSLGIHRSLRVHDMVLVRPAPIQGTTGQPRQRFYRIVREHGRELEHRRETTYQVVLDVERRRKVGGVSGHQRSGVQRVSHDGQGVHHLQECHASRRCLLHLRILLPRILFRADVHRSWHRAGSVQSRRVQ